MRVSSERKIIEAGLKASNDNICQEDKIWSRYSNDKVDIGEELARVVRTLAKALPLSRKMTAFSIGSSAEPQFRILETAFRGGLYLLDVEKEALNIVKERIRRQCTDHVTTILDDYNKVFLDSQKTARFLKTMLGNKKMNLITLHHSLYYSDEAVWRVIFDNLYRQILTPRGALHAVLMAAESDNQYTTTWLYNHFVGKFFGSRNGQNLLNLRKVLRADAAFRKAQIFSKTNYIRFFVSDFTEFMAVIWMILLYPNVHKYSLKQREEIVEFVYKRFWKRKKPLLQAQDHLVIYRGIGFRGLA